MTDPGGRPGHVGGLAAAAMRLRHETVARISGRPCLYFPLIRLHLLLTRRRGLAVPAEKDTEIIIEGYPRCANTFAVRAFETAQGRPVRIAHHLHVAAQIIAGVKHNTPVLLLTREPTDAVASYLIRHRSMTPRGALREYIRFHRLAMPHRGGFVVATFDQVTSDFGQVIRRVNVAFGTSFLEFEHTEENVSKCFRRMEEINREYHGGLHVREDRVPRPSEARQARKPSILRCIKAPTVAPLLTEAREIYAQFESYAHEDPDRTVESRMT